MNNINENYQASLSVQNRLNDTNDSIMHLNTRIQDLHNMITEMCDSITVNDLSIQKINAKIEELESLKKESIDYAFVVLDPRQEESETLGIDYFIKNVGARFIFPMHCWEQYDIIERYKRNNDRKFLTGQIIDITGQEQQFILE